MRKLKTPPKSIADALDYDPHNGVFVWVKNGAEAGALAVSGYIQISYKNKLYYAHRLAFLFMEGSMPENLVDHINGVRSDNRWVNLRHCSELENPQNMLTGRKGRLPGVTWQAGKFVAQIKADGKNHYLGRFWTEEEAHEAYVEAKRRLHTFSPEVRVQADAI